MEKTYKVSLTQTEIDILIKCIECAGYHRAMCPATTSTAGNIIEKFRKVKES